MKELFIPKASWEKIQTLLRNKGVKDTENVLALRLDRHTYDTLFWALRTTTASNQRMDVDVTKEWIKRHPLSVYFEDIAADRDRSVSPYQADLELTIVQNIATLANQVDITPLATSKKIVAIVVSTSMDEYLHLPMLASPSVRFSKLFREVFLVLHERRADCNGITSRELHRNDDQQPASARRLAPLWVSLRLTSWRTSPLSEQLSATPGACERRGLNIVLVLLAFIPR